MANWLEATFFSQCLPADTLAIYSISEQSRLDGRGLQELCPTMLQQLDAGTCRAHNKEELNGDTSPRPSDAEGEHWLLFLLQHIHHHHYHHSECPLSEKITNKTSNTFLHKVLAPGFASCCLDNVNITWCPQRTWKPNKTSTVCQDSYCNSQFGLKTPHICPPLQSCLSQSVSRAFTQVRTDRT